MNKLKIPTYVINRKVRTDRKEHILREFKDKDIFNVTIVEACEHETGAQGQWDSIRNILANVADQSSEYILICEDDHQFTADYSDEYLLKCINEAVEQEVDILSGGLSWLDGIVPVTENLFWVRGFVGTQFIIIFRKFFKTILESEFIMSESKAGDVKSVLFVDLADLANNDIAGFKLSSLTDHKFFIYPFISVQKDFGYSDVTGGDAPAAELLFDAAMVKVESAQDILSFYKKAPLKTVPIPDYIHIPTYVVNLPKRTDRKEHIKNEFLGRDEFDVTIVDAYEHEIGAVGLWLTIRKIVEMAVHEDHDVIILCEDDHQFTPDYSKQFFIENVVQAQMQGANYLSGGSGYFGLAVPVAPNRYWVNPSCSTQFVVIYKKFFRRILAEPFDDTVIADRFLSDMTSNRMVFYPYISVQKDFGYSDATKLHEVNVGMMDELFNNCISRLGDIQRAAVKWKLFEAD